MRPIIALLVLATLAFAPASARGGAWTLGRGQLYLKESFSFWRTDRKFASSLDRQLTFSDRAGVDLGDRIPFDPATGGVFRAFTWTTDLRLGLTDWLDVGFSVPLVSANFDTSPVDTVEGSFGPGDLLVAVQAGFQPGPLALAGKLEIKAPTGRFDPSIYSAPLTEGQWDVALFASLGVSLAPWGYANAEVGWKFRTTNSHSGVDHGDELLLLVEGGLELPWGFMLKLALDGLFGFDGEAEQFGSLSEVPRRRLLSTWAGLLWRSPVGVTLDLAGRFLLAGEDHPTGVQVLAGVAYQFQLFGKPNQGR